jgi:hypothetical protein
MSTQEQNPLGQAAMKMLRQEVPDEERGQLNLPKGLTYAEAIACLLVRAAARGDNKALRLLRRMFGKTAAEKFLDLAREVGGQTPGG